MHVSNISPREYLTWTLVASIRSSPVDYCGSASSSFTWAGWACCLFQCWPVRCCSVLCAMRIFAEDRWRPTSKYDISRWGYSGRGEIKVFEHPVGIEPATSHLWDEDGTTRPLPVRLHCMLFKSLKLTLKWTCVFLLIPPNRPRNRPRLSRRPRTARVEKDWTRTQRQWRMTTDFCSLHFNDCTALLGLITMEPVMWSGHI
jgi:hypothetical protein